MQHTSYLERREQIEHYFDRTAAKAWEVLTSNAPVGRIRRTSRHAWHTFARCWMWHRCAGD